MFDFTDPKQLAAASAVIAAVVAGLFSLMGIMFTQRKTRQTQETIIRLQSDQATTLERLRAEQSAVLETFKARLGEEKDERAARRDYEYDARKRLYEQCDPLLFQFADLSENAFGRITNLVKACQDNNLRPDGSGWLDHEGYYFLTMLYRLVVPCVIFQLLQRRLTLLDLRLDRRISTQFAFCRILYLTFRHDWEMANTEPKLPYNPDHEKAETLRIEQPSVYWRQGVYAGHLERAVESLIVSDQGQQPRFIRYGEFAAAYADKRSELHRAFAPVADLFRGFHPATRPILWRILVAQAYIYRALQSSGDAGTTPVNGREALLTALCDPADWLDWSPSGEKPNRQHVAAVEAARHYLTAVADRLPATTA
jgi:hypothetical protein